MTNCQTLLGGAFRPSRRHGFVGGRDSRHRSGATNANAGRQSGLAVVVPPTIEQLRQEVEANPNRTPQSLIVFAAHAHERLRQVRSEKTEQALSSELEVSLNEPEQLPVVVQATYLEHARQLAKRYPIMEAAVAIIWHDLALQLVD